MAPAILADIEVHPGEHKINWHVGPFTLHVDTILGDGDRRRHRHRSRFLHAAAELSVRKPGKVQLFYETVVDQVEKQVDDTMGVQIAPFVVPLAFSLFLFILIANWLALIPTGTSGIRPAAGVRSEPDLRARLLRHRHDARDGRYDERRSAATTGTSGRSRTRAHAAAILSRRSSSRSRSHCVCSATSSPA